MTYLMSLIFKFGPDRSLPGRKIASSLLANGAGMYDNDKTSYIRSKFGLHYFRLAKAGLIKMIIYILSAKAFTFTKHSINRINLLYVAS